MAQSRFLCAFSNATKISTTKNLFANNAAKPSNIVSNVSSTPQCSNALSVKLVSPLQMIKLYALIVKMILWDVSTVSTSPLVKIAMTRIISLKTVQNANAISATFLTINHAWLAPL